MKELEMLISDTDSILKNKDSKMSEAEKEHLEKILYWLIEFREFCEENKNLFDECIKPTDIVYGCSCFFFRSIDNQNVTGKMMIEKAMEYINEKLDENPNYLLDGVNIFSTSGTSLCDKFTYKVRFKKVEEEEYDVY